MSGINMRPIAVSVFAATGASDPFWHLRPWHAQWVLLPLWNAHDRLPPGRRLRIHYPRPDAANDPEPDTQTPPEA